MPVSSGQVTHAPLHRGCGCGGDGPEIYRGISLGPRERKMGSRMLTWCVRAQKHSREKSVRTIGQGFSSKLYTKTRVLCVARVPWAKITFLSFWYLSLQLLIADTTDEQMASKSYGENLESTSHT